LRKRTCQERRHGIGKPLAVWLISPYGRDAGEFRPVSSVSFVGPTTDEKREDSNGPFAQPKQIRGARLRVRRNSPTRRAAMKQQALSLAIN
jgi:hypothetical protein